MLLDWALHFKMPQVYDAHYLALAEGLKGEFWTADEKLYKCGQRAIGMGEEVRELSMSERRVILYPGEDGYWVVECPSLPECISQGKTKEEAIENIKEAIALYIESLQAHGDPTPEETDESFIVTV